MNLRKLRMAVPSKQSTIFLAFLLLTFSLTCGQDNESQKMREDQERLLSKLIQAERESDLESAARKEDGLVVTVQNQGSGRRRIDIFKEGLEIERIIQDCQNKYELIIMNKDDEDAVGRCNVHKMEDRQYEADCNASGEKLERKYGIGLEIENKAILSNIEGAEDCLERHTFELIAVSVEAQSTEEKNDKSDVSMRSRCTIKFDKTSVCIKYCQQYGWWTSSRKCKQEGVKCEPKLSFSSVCG